MAARKAMSVIIFILTVLLMLVLLNNKPASYQCPGLSDRGEVEFTC